VNMSLEELKRENAGLESEVEETPNPEVEKQEEAVEETEVESENTEGSEESEGTEEESIEPWMRCDDQTSQKDETVPVSDLIKMRQKLKGKNQDQKQEIEELKTEIKNLKANAPQPVVSAAAKPKREDFLDADDPEEAYIDALSDWKISQSAAIESQRKQRKQQEKAQAEVQKRVDDHLERAAKLCSDHKLSTDIYLSADSKFRDAVNSAFPEAKENAMPDAIISQIGDGSEKLVMYIGNSERRSGELQSALMRDPSGLAAMRLIGKWESEIQVPKTRVSKAQKPAVRVKPGESADVSSGLRKKYQSHHDKGNAQKAFEVKRAAKAQNIDTSNW
jgi:hypothetical protein